eukprot:TRINITY_DN17448_c0_g2_i1.p1 TRINITY_DN17448_c0_g2~~TRINITY_DN17448_c0_g2_i1.p1  ORF type:complete len:329 (-),score=60.07 TRINITY_DN17448_c0_g2_i1:89-1075(-)
MCIRDRRSVVGRVQDILRRQINSSFEPTSIPWRLKSEVLLKPQDVSNKQKGRFEKWKADLCIISQSTEEAFLFLKNAMNECKNQGDTLWLISTNTVRAATIAKGREIAGQKLLNAPLENDEAVRLIEQTIGEYGKCGEVFLEIETAFKLINTYKKLECRYAMLEKMKWVEQNLLGKWNREDLVEIYARMAQICMEVNCEKKAACYAYKCLSNYSVKHKGNEPFLRKMMKLMGLCEHPEKLIARTYEEALANATTVENRIYLFEYKSLMESDKLTLATKRLPENCTVFLRKKDPILKHNFEAQTWPEVQRKFVNLISSMANQSEISIHL